MGRRCTTMGVVAQCLEQVALMTARSSAHWQHLTEKRQRSQNYRRSRELLPSRDFPLEADCPARCARRPWVR
jgi:hypothetical protein